MMVLEGDSQIRIRRGEGPGRQGQRGDPAEGMRSPRRPTEGGRGRGVRQDQAQVQAQDCRVVFVLQRSSRTHPSASASEKVRFAELREHPYGRPDCTATG